MNELNGPLISIIVPVYNTEDYLQECVDSIRRQSYSNIEILLITEPCTDNSEKLCDEMAQSDRRIRVFHKPALSGVSRSRNIGLRESRGDYLMFVDSDDFIDPAMVQDLLEAIIYFDADVAKCGIILNENGKESELAHNIPDDFKMPFPEAFEYVLGELHTKRFSGHMTDKLVKKERVYQENGDLILFDEELNHSEDIHWLIRVFLNCDSISFIHNPLYHYRRNRPGNTYSELYSLKSLKYSQSAIRSYEEIYQILLKADIPAKRNAYHRMINHRIKAGIAASVLSFDYEKNCFLHGIEKMIFCFVIMEHSLYGAIAGLKALIKVALIRVGYYKRKNNGKQEN